MLCFIFPNRLLFKFGWYISLEICCGALCEADLFASFFFVGLFVCLYVCFVFVIYVLASNEKSTAITHTHTKYKQGNTKNTIQIHFSLGRHRFVLQFVCGIIPLVRSILIRNHLLVCLFIYFCLTQFFFIPFSIVDHWNLFSRQQTIAHTMFNYFT